MVTLPADLDAEAVACAAHERHLRTCICALRSRGWEQRWTRTRGTQTGRHRILRTRHAGVSFAPNCYLRIAMPVSNGTTAGASVLPMLVVTDRAHGCPMKAR
jgi:hypothetical protein